MICLDESIDLQCQTILDIQQFIQQLQLKQHEIIFLIHTNEETKQLHCTNRSTDHATLEHDTYKEEPRLENTVVTVNETETYQHAQLRTHNGSIHTMIQQCGLINIVQQQHHQGKPLPTYN